MKNDPTPIQTELYTAQAADDRAKAQKEIGVPDPSTEEGENAIAENTTEQ